MINHDSDCKVNGYDTKKGIVYALEAECDCSKPFDLNNTADLPKELINELTEFFRDEFEKKIIEIFWIANRQLTIDEIIVGYYRVFKVQKTRKQMNAKLYNMTRATHPVIEVVEGKRGVYQLIKGER